MKLEHTPGPWVNGHSIIFNADKRSSEFGGAQRIAKIQQDNCFYGEFFANARLIATAPEMLEALIISAQVFEVYDFISHYPSGESFDQYARIRIIEKATGKTWEELNA